jgi:catechol 2,3-dioxygenase-like lactoylglutathione lyase family enzyme
MPNFIRITPFMHVPVVSAAVAFFTDTLGFKAHVHSPDYAYVQRETAAIRIRRRARPRHPRLPLLHRRPRRKRTLRRAETQARCPPYRQRPRPRRPDLRPARVHGPRPRRRPRCLRPDPLPYARRIAEVADLTPAHTAGPLTLNCYHPHLTARGEPQCHRAFTTEPPNITT